MHKLSIALTALAMVLLSACSENKRSPPDDGDEFHALGSIEAGKATEADERWALCVNHVMGASGHDWSAEAVQFFADSPPWNRSIHEQMSANFAAVYRHLDAHCASAE
ncbi:MAG TPA: hypothetical protein PLZ57_07640 [Pseudobdellovibrionaceae bacterium]|nr:hypothetical protein [Pseudobdellovibrionaceae bacterium]